MWLVTVSNAVGDWNTWIIQWAKDEKKTGNRRVNFQHLETLWFNILAFSFSLPPWQYKSCFIWAATCRWWRSAEVISLESEAQEILFFILHISNLVSLMVHKANYSITEGPFSSRVNQLSLSVLVYRITNIFKPSYFFIENYLDSLSDIWFIPLK